MPKTIITQSQFVKALNDAQSISYIDYDIEYDFDKDTHAKYCKGIAWNVVELTAQDSNNDSEEPLFEVSYVERFYQQIDNPESLNANIEENTQCQGYNFTNYRQVNKVVVVDEDGNVLSKQEMYELIQKQSAFVKMIENIDYSFILPPP